MVGNWVVAQWWIWCGVEVHWVVAVVLLGGWVEVGCNDCGGLGEIEVTRVLLGRRRVRRKY